MNVIMHEGVRSVYIHWPFCPYKCHFCPFVALASHDDFMGRYAQALCAEIRRSSSWTLPLLPLQTIYMGGGTPSTCPDDLLLDIVGTLRSVISNQPTVEITLEVNPGTVRSEQLGLWKALGVNRLSIGVQSLKDGVLQELNRHQSLADVYRVLEQASAIFNNLSVDLILGLPGVSAQEWRSTIEQVVTWPIQHVSVYFLTVHEGTPLYFKVQRNTVNLVSNDTMVDEYLWTCDYIVNKGFEQYEISSFARSGYQSRHNKVYWARQPYQAYGLGACSFDGATRMQNEKNLMRYMNMVEQGQSPVVFQETLTREQVHREKVMLGLRQMVGLSHRELFEDLEGNESAHVAERIGLLEREQFLVLRDDRFILTPKGLAVENALAAFLSL